ncbi:MAG: ABC-2 family transporter protein, partial [Elusimicrobia bacterium]|nr:ABC-2 family transporter protein [Elusimicrobiota bacterium]
MRLSKYLYIFKNGWQYQLEYRLNTIIRFLIAFISLISIFYLWSSVYGEKVSLMGYSKESIITYFILIGYLTASIYTYPSIDSEIRDGTLSIYLTKPIKYMFMHYWKELSKAVFRLITALPILLLIFFIFKDSIYFVKDPVQYLILILTIFGAFNILFLINIL